MQIPWEIGSEFDWSDQNLLKVKTRSLFPQKYELFSTGTAALLSIAKVINQEQKKLKIHIPCFFCMYVVAKLQQAFEICWYRDLPTDDAPDFDSLKVSPGDLVLAVNLFGIREQKVWQNWFSKHSELIVIEDHTHDPFSLWAKSSTAHYCISSLRKTLPLPDGAIIWSPQNLNLPRSSQRESSGAYKKLTAMLLKKAYLKGVNISKDIYRKLEIESREDLDDESQSAVSLFTETILEYLAIDDFRKQREANINYFCHAFDCLIKPHGQLLFKTWNKNNVPFNSILIFNNHKIRDALQKYLIKHQIFTAIHWSQSHQTINSGDQLAIELSERILTIPTDQRYSLQDIDKIITIIMNFF